ncbi:sulfurtransferase TusA family protein [Taylorella equigenitalis]|uniref:Molybdopterin biosynthesis MoeB protein n=3 Tax=Taylorella equigenitalis TaxID=29575 RepID=A0A654KI77_TAYEM|nr:sulfurtransferase TusA family protein [Taylorella equigenitalis]ADU92151.1 Molybdopterin biosynthesis MoeB protein [Taylorella equigenitalis MCE9]AFN35712.1 SirA-like protein [Taylorella equigenitalis ATCC 35865]ASY30358.1 preprotein translocase subunit TatC [Taylorella equigenitalis]ASY37664.1 preprotein translocase subunit TatC [Taylorella equigenitalis]ASY39132.1 preprotein translocase subunit TatC [Taylorella equigenitalis]
MDYDLFIDTSGLLCPLPLLKTKKGLSEIESGQVICVKTTDPHSSKDFELFCKQTGNKLLKQEADSDGMKHWISRK